MEPALAGSQDASIAGRVRSCRIDAATSAAPRELKPPVFQELPPILDGVHGHVSQCPEVARIFANTQHMRHGTAMRLGDRTTIVPGSFEETAAGYKKRTRMIAAIRTAALPDSDPAISPDLDAGARDRRATPAGPAAAFAERAGSIVPAVFSLSAAGGTSPAAASIDGVNSPAAETGAASVQVLGPANSPAAGSDRLKTDVGNFLKTMRCARGGGDPPAAASFCGGLRAEETAAIS